MTHRRLLLLSPTVLASLAAPALAQSAAAPPPQAYTVTAVMQEGPSKVTTVTYRDGQAAVMDYPDTHQRSYLDLAAGRTYGWSTTGPVSDCSSGTFSGDWGDPFQTGGLTGELAKLNPRDAGFEVVNGIRARRLEADNPADGSKVRMWVDTTYGELVKWVGVGPDGKMGTLFETKNLTLGKPPRSVFTMPASCVKLASQPLPPTAAQRIAALTGSAPGTYVSASTGPASKESCAVTFSVVQPNTLVPIAMAYRMAVDPAYDADHPAAYNIGQDITNPSKPFFSGGGLHEITDQLKGGSVKLTGLSSEFSIELVFAGDAGFGSATVYRQCGGKSAARLLYVLKTTGKPSDGGEWVWAP